MQVKKVAVIGSKMNKNSSNDEGNMNLKKPKLVKPKQNIYALFTQIQRKGVNFSTNINTCYQRQAIVSKEYLAISSKYDKLSTSIRTAHAEESNLKKDQTSYDDLLDALRLAL